MVEIDRLKQRARWAYETDRLGAAAQVAWVVVPLIGLSVAVSRPVPAVLAGVGLLIASVWLRWRHQLGEVAVGRGLIAGTAPLVVGLLLARGTLGCELTVCLTSAVVGGLAAGGWLALRSRRAPTRPSVVLSSFAIATLAACPGCATLTVREVAALCVGVLPGLVAALWFSRRGPLPSPT